MMTTDAAQWKLLGPARSVLSEVAEWDLERGTWKDRRFFRSVVFDASGRIAHLDQRGLHESRYRTGYVYDARGCPIEEASGTVGEQAQFVRRWAYDGEGRETSISIMRAGGTENVWQRSTYDEEGRRTDRVTFEPRHDTNAHAYGIKGSEFAYGAPAAVMQITRYDATGQPVDVEFLDADGAIVRRVQMTRDRDGRMLVEEADMPLPFAFERDPGMSDAQFQAMRAMMATAVGSMRTVYEYDASGRPASRVRITGQLGEHRTTYRYDERGEPIEQSEVSVDREMSADDDGVPHCGPDTTRVHDVRFAYVYDGHGNWTERVVSARFTHDGEFRPTNAEWRTIEYWRT